MYAEAWGASPRALAQIRLVQTIPEKMLYDNGTHILKFYLHIDRDEQPLRFKQRIEDPARHCKISEGDYAERPFWDATPTPSRPRSI